MTATTPPSSPAGAAVPPLESATDHSDRLVPIPTPRARMRGALLRRFAPRLVAQVTTDALEVGMPDGTVLRSPGADRDAVRVGRIDIVDERAFEQVAARGQRGFGEAFVLGMWTSPDPATAVEVILHATRANRRRLPLRLMNLVQRLRPTWQRRNGTRSARRHIAYHYDLGNDFFEQFLDPSMTYSCATFDDSHDDLYDAQLAKYDGICQQLGLTSGDRVLEIGCGWGGFAEHAARRYGAHVTGVTISERQHEFATRRMAGAGLTDLVDIRLQDYREVEGTFDKIVSIEMLEAVGAREYGTYFRTVDRLLAPTGAALVQVIGFQDRDYARQLRTRGWIRRYVFPGGMLPTVTVLSRRMTRTSSLQVQGLREIGHHYGPTLRDWRGRLVANGDHLQHLGYGPRLRRSWEYYFAICEAGFRSGHIRTMQLLLVHAGTVPE